ncbi:MAG: clan AA aspartic protease [Acidisphaera sp.]|nr:clan AA aspartic protease [Acidisphaera sp.]
MRDGFVAAPAAIDGTPVTLLVDTGAEGTLVTPDLADALHLPRDNRHLSRLYGPGGELLSANAALRSLRVGPFDLPDRRVNVGALPQNRGNAGPFGGILGADILAHFDVDLDIPRGELTFYAVQDCAGRFLPWDAPYGAVPALRSRYDRFLVSLEVDGTPLSAVLDSGARASVMSEAAAARLDVDAQALAGEPAGSGEGIDRNAMTYHRHRFASVRVGAEVFNDQPIEVAPLRLREGDMLLGADFLRTRRVWISYSTGQVFIAAP